jgi:hypothetical protein
MAKYRVQIGTAGNTMEPVLITLQHKGYKVALDHVECPGDQDALLYTATNEDRIFSANTVEGLLGLIAMWEFRGDDWKGKRDDPDPPLSYLLFRSK